MSTYFIVIILTLLGVLALAIWKREREFGSGWHNQEGKKIAIHNKELHCHHCGGQNFRKMEGKISTSVMLYFFLGFLNRSATCFTCIDCGFVHWFLSPKEKAFREFDRDEF